MITRLCFPRGLGPRGKAPACSGPPFDIISAGVDGSACRSDRTAVAEKRAGCYGSCVRGANQTGEIHDPLMVQESTQASQDRVHPLHSSFGGAGGAVGMSDLHPWSAALR